jgi:Tfp pilus assembly protein PilO
VSARGKEVYIITGVLVVVVCVAWFFLLYNPLRKDISALGTQIDEAQQQITTAQADLSRLKSYEKTSPQTRADLLRLNKMLPSQTGIPSIIIEITRTAEESGLEFSSIEPGQILPGQPFSVQPINLSFAGQYFDLEDFLFRLESYVEYRNNAFLVTGRLLQVASIAITRGTDAESSGLQITMTINCYLWSSQQASTANTTQPAPLPSASPSPTASPSPGLSPGATESPSPGASPFATPSGSPAASPASPSPSPSEVSP